MMSLFSNVRRRQKSVRRNGYLRFDVICVFSKHIVYPISFGKDTTKDVLYTYRLYTISRALLTRYLFVYVSYF